MSNEVTHRDISAQPDSRGYYTVIEHLEDGTTMTYEVFASKARMNSLIKNKQAKSIADAVAIVQPVKPVEPAPLGLLKPVKETNL